MMQDPFDLLAIQMLLFDVRPGQLRVCCGSNLRSLLCGLGSFACMREQPQPAAQNMWYGCCAFAGPCGDPCTLHFSLHIPDLVIETGTANGGSALLWASVLENSDLHSTR